MLTHPQSCKLPWSTKTFNGYLGEDKSIRSEHNATELVLKYKGLMPVVLEDHCRLIMGCELVSKV